jgi:hypothetical protein
MEEPDFIVDVSGKEEKDWKWIKKPMENTMNKVKMVEPKGQFSEKGLANAGYFKKLTAGQRPVVLEDIGIFDEPERKLEPWTFKGIKWFRYRDYVWLNEDGVKGDFAGKFDGHKIDASVSEPKW